MTAPSHTAPLPASSLRVSLVQGDTRWHDPQANRAYYGALVESLAGRSDLVVLPETFTSGFSNEALGSAEDMDGPTVAWFRSLAQSTGMSVVAEGIADQDQLDMLLSVGCHLGQGFFMAKPMAYEGLEAALT